MQRAARHFGRTTRRCRALGVRGCCDVVNRGVAAWNGKIYVGTFDGRLVALDARTGRQIWSVMTVDPDKPYTITQAPRVIKGRVVIGNSGAEYGVRGYISAYDAENGDARLAVLHRTRRSSQSARTADSRRSRQDLAWRVVEGWRRGNGVGKPLIRPRVQPHLFRRQQRLEWNQGTA